MYRATQASATIVMSDQESSDKGLILDWNCLPIPKNPPIPPDARLLVPSTRISRSSRFEFEVWRSGVALPGLGQPQSDSDISKIDIYASPFCLPFKKMTGKNTVRPKFPFPTPPARNINAAYTVAVLSGVTRGRY